MAFAQSLCIYVQTAGKSEIFDIGMDYNNGSILKDPESASVVASPFTITKREQRTSDPLLKDLQPVEMQINNVHSLIRI